MKALIGGIFALIIVVAIAVACLWIGYQMRDAVSENNSETTIEQQNEPNKTNENQNNQPLNDIHLALGNPSNANANPSNANNYLLTNKYYALSYNRQKAIANWVAWRISKNYFGDAERQNDFRPDERLPSGWTQITPYDYNGSGFDRGHMCPSADRSSSIEGNSSTFLMTNISPQTKALNQGPWEKLESYSRSMARRNVTLYIIAGQYGDSGKIKNKITIPSNFWKIVVVVPNDGNISQINKDTRIIAVDMPNNDDIKESNWREFKTTVRQIEQKTGYNFFSNLPQNLQNDLETKVDTRQ
ncbi:MAG: DNA/RNA non-specific endonuclease [Pyrinomonadaceae bacterium]|jgi:endonuclease G|nr:DNA/RNA non-specific endonuclease [Pyrinomonadaceae bacterium]